ncbi:MAG: ubiquinone/menaquinone biosynthesis methyltransferase [Dehalococcoidia bacterium]|nr:MAG: ubiquinone/menaquinone biosynthesis methyltransferase [Dehalococcoidia bacterium]
MNEKPRTPNQPLYGIFTAVPPRYDLINHIITLGMDIRWRRLAAKACLEGQPKRALDLACGTGDLALNLAIYSEEGTEINGLDYSPPMLERAREKAKRARLAQKIKFIYGEVTSLPFPDDHLDCVGISFAFRNLTYKNPICTSHLAEVLRVLRKDGRYVIVESSQPESQFVKRLFHFYLRAFVTPVGVLLSGNRSAYTYLAQSAADFFTSEKIKAMLITAGFKTVGYRELFYGAAGIHIAIK